MAKANKTTETDASVRSFLQTFVDSEQKRNDSLRLIELMRQWTGCEAKMWGPSIVGFGSYHYKYASGHEGDAPRLAFSPRKAAFSLYVIAPGQDQSELLAQLGKCKISKACVYVKKLDDIDLSVLEKISMAAMQFTRDHVETK